METFKKNLAANITRRRAELGITQAELAERAGLSLNMVQKCEYKLTWPSPSTLEVLSEALECAPHELFLGPDDTKLSQSMQSNSALSSTIAELYTELAALHKVVEDYRKDSAKSKGTTTLKPRERALVEGYRESEPAFQLMTLVFATQDRKYLKELLELIREGNRQAHAAVDAIQKIASSVLAFRKR